MTFVLLAMATGTLYVVGAAAARRRTAGVWRHPWIQRYVTGTTYIGLGLASALTGHGRR